MHALIVGPRGVGKSTLIRRVLENVDMPVFGFESKKEIRLEDPEKGSPVYIYEAGKPHVQSAENLVGYCKKHRMAPLPSGFDRFAPKLTGPVPAGHLVLMDEIGFLEATSEPFCAAVLGLLDGDTPVIAAVKDKDIPFLEAVRSHPNCRCFFITEENRDELFAEVLAFVKGQVMA